MPKLRAWSLVRRVYALVRGVGRKRLAVAVVMVVAQGLAQVVGVTSIFPFLQIATDPEAFRSSRVADWLPITELSDRALLLWSGGACIGLLFASNMITLAAIVTRARYVQAVATHLRKVIFRDVLTQPYSFFLETNSSELYQQVHVDVDLFEQNVLAPCLNAVASGVTVVVLLTTVALAQPSAAMIAVLGGGIFYVAVYCVVRPRARQVGEDFRKHNLRMLNGLLEALANVKTVLAFDKATFVRERFDDASDTKARLLPRAELYAQFPKYVIEPIALGSMIALMVAAALSEGALDAALPSLGVLALSGYRLLPHAQYLYQQAAGITTFAHVVSKMERRDFAAATSCSARGPSEPVTFEEQITFERVSFRYPRAKESVLSDVSVSIPKNTTVGISGPSGSGKSTFIDLLLGLHTPCKGCVRIDSRALMAQHLPGWRARVAYVPQEVHMFDDTVASNIAFGVSPDQVDQALLREVAGAAQLLPFIEHDLPDGFETLIGERGARLSGGQRQRLGLARALYRRPEVLILDEATSALDTETETMVMDALRRLHGKLTMVVIAHRTDTLKICDMRLDFPLGLVRT